MSNLVPVILAGGSGTRLWPLSRKLYPKQFQPLIGEHSMLQQTLLRLVGLQHAPALVICSEEHRFLVAEQCRAIDVQPASIVLEPAPRNTAPAIALGAFKALEQHADPILLVLPSDHHIQHAEIFRSLVHKASQLPAERLATFGIVPTGPETGYGYIRAGDVVPGVDGASVVAAFVEKPDRGRAQELVSDGLHLWNSGMFLFRAKTYLAELETHRPDIFRAVQEAHREGKTDYDFFRPGSAFADCPTDSIDYAVMERTQQAVVFPADIGWNDVGCWKALWGALPRDANGNSKTGDVVDIDTQNSFIHADHRLVTTIGMDDAVVVETRDAVLVARKDRVQDVKKLVDGLRNKERAEHETHVRVYRPWGSYEGLEEGPGFQVKRISVKPGASLSLQKHQHRSEHWIVVSGVADVVRGEDRFQLHANESTYIPVGAVHRLANPTDEVLELIEVQVGGYLGEDDIIRLKDSYGRS